MFMSICNVTYHRQQEAEELAKQCDVMLVVGGRNSANTKKLALVCEEQPLHKLTWWKRPRNLIRHGSREWNLWG